MREYRLAQLMPLRVLRELYTVVPSQVALTLMILDTKGTVLLKGQAPSMSEVFALVSALEESSLFHNVQVRYANKRQTQEREIADFEVQCPLDLTAKGAHQ
jgi:Tfp pilus assembly protein PilN